MLEIIFIGKNKNQILMSNLLILEKPFLKITENYFDTSLFRVKLVKKVLNGGQNSCSLVRISHTLSHLNYQNN